MAAVVDKLTITYGGQAVGGDSSSTNYQLHGPHVVDKSYDTLRLVFDVIVVGTSYADLRTKADTLETAFRKRLTHGQTLVIDLGGSVWTYTQGSTMLNAEASIQKSGNVDTDRGFSRAYTVSIQAGLPADADNGLRDVEVLVDYEPSRQRIVTMRGVYTALSGTDAVAKYQADFDAEASVYLTAIDGAATWELIDETFTHDRQLNVTPFSHTCQFTRQYVELLANQTIAAKDDTDVRDHRIVFTDLSQHPGDSDKDIYRLRRVVGVYECALDIDQTTDLKGTFDAKILPHIKALFETNFKPRVFAVEESRANFDETAKRMSVSVQFIYQKAAGSSKIVEVSQSVGFRESRTIDYTFTHGGDELGAYVDPGFAVLELVLTRTVIVLGRESPHLRISQNDRRGSDGFSKLGGDFGLSGIVTTKGKTLNREGWNITENTSEVTPQYLGDPDHGQIELSVLNETIVNRFNRQPEARTVSPIKKTPITG